MKKISDDMATIIAETAGPRADFVAEAGACQRCKVRPACECHEITNGHGIRKLALYHRCCWLALCSACHREVGNWPKEKQLALKLCADAEHLDLLKVAEVRGRAPTSIVLADLVPWLEFKE